MSKLAMGQLLQRWQGLAPREQWLAYCVGLALLAALYLMLLGEPLSTRLIKLEAERKVAEARRLEAQAGLAELVAKRAADPNLPYRSTLLAAQASREQLLGSIDQSTAGLVAPDTMKRLLQDLLRAQPKLRLLGLESFSAPLQLPGMQKLEQTAVATKELPSVAPLTLYRHGMRLTLEGGYFDLLTYLQAIDGSEWRLHWEHLEYQVEEAGPGHARITLELYTLSKEAGWIGV